MVKRVVLLALAGILLLLSAALGTAAAWGYSALGADGVMRFDLGTITPDPASQSTVIDVDRYSLSVPYIQSLGTVTLEATTSEAGDPSGVLFLGAATTADVDAYLKGTPYSVAVLIDGEWDARQVPGSATAAPPREQGFWLAAAVGRAPAIQVPDQRPLTLVITHPSGLPTGPFALRFGFTVPDAPTWILAMAVAAALLLIVAIVLAIMAFRVKKVPRHRGKHEAEPEIVPAAVAAVAVTVDETEPVTQALPTLEAEPEAAVEPVPEAEPAAAVEPVPEPVPEPEVTVEPVPEPEPEATVEPEPEPVPEPEPAPDLEPAPQEQVEAPDPAPESDDEPKPGDAADT